VLVFFDDILIYSTSWVAHLQHVGLVLSALRAHGLFLKRSKCSFGASSVAYLGHVISADGVAMDSDKVAAVAAWPVPRSPRGVRGFLGLAGYYRKFIKDFGSIAAPLTRLLRKEAFVWDTEAAEAFERLKRALSSAPVLQMPDFERQFVVDCDASGTGFGAVLHQGAGPLAFFSRPFAARHGKLAAYERELIGLVQAVRHWRPYLWGRRFLVRTDHYSLKFLLDQRLSTVPQHQWLSKLFGFDFAVEYRPGRLNTAADALSRRDEEGPAVLLMSGPSFRLYDDIRAAMALDQEAGELLQQLDRGTLDGPWRVAEGLLLHGKRIFVPRHGDLRHQVVALAHTAGHEGIQKTLVRLRQDFYLPGDRALVQDFVRSCDTCQRNKTPTTHPAGLLQPLEVPSQVWADISMDFIDGLPKVHGKSVILTVVDRFSKYAHFIALSHPYSAASVARAFFDGIVRLHGFPTSIVSDRDPVFTSHLWRDLFQLAGVKQRLSTAFHPQTDGQSEVVNRIIVMYLWCVTGDRPRAWVDWLSWAEYCYNTSFQTALRATPFEVVYGRPPPPLLPLQPGAALTEAAESLLRDRDAFLEEVRERLLQAQQYAKKYYDVHHRDVSFEVGDWVLLRLLHRPMQALIAQPKGKLRPRYAGPFQVLERIGAVAYRLQLPPGARLHDVFHVGQLKAYEGPPPTAPAPLPPVQDGRLLPSPERVLKAQLRRGEWRILVQWQGLPADDATWEPLAKFKEQFPEVQLEDELFEEAGRDVMTGVHYERRGRQARG
jgi:transposase InsO family protein